MLIHICNNFISSKVHSNLVQKIAEMCAVRQLVFVPIRSEAHRDCFYISSSRVSTVYRHCQGRILRFFPLLKILSTLAALLFSLRSRPVSREDHVLAHTLWSDGCVAYLYKLLSGQSYSVVVRNTDLNWFIPKLPHYRWLMSKILGSAEAVIFVSPAHRKRLELGYPRLFRSAARITIIPNGVDKVWLDDLMTTVKVRPPVVTFVGRFDRNKNLDGILKAVEVARRSLPDLRLVLVGGDTASLVKLLCLESVPSWVECVGHVGDQRCVRDFYRNSRVFLLPSHTETFGLVYIEALSQGCPFIYSQGEGVDGFFDGESYCVGIDPSQPDLIGSAIVDLAARFPQGVASENFEERLAAFSWANVARRYLDLMNIEPR